MTNDKSAGLGDLIRRLEYRVGNPSAWPEGFDEQGSDLMREAVAALRSTPASTAMEDAADVADLRLTASRLRNLGEKLSVADRLDAAANTIEMLLASQPQHLGEVKVTDELEKAKGQAIDLLLSADQVWEDYGSGFRIHFSFLPNTSMNVVERIHTALSLASSPRGDR